MIQLNEIAYGFGSKNLVTDFQLHVKRGEHVVITGASGRGKSTLLRLIMGFLPTWYGSVMVDSLSLQPAHIKMIRARISWLPQQLPRMAETANDLFRFMVQWKVVDQEPRLELAVNELLEAMRLPSEVWNQKISELSGGQRQRLGLLFCGLMKRTIWLLDEPTSALDRDSASAVFAYIRRSTVTILSVSHDRRWQQLADRVVAL